MPLSTGSQIAKQKLKALAVKVSKDNDENAFFEGMVDIFTELIKSGDIILAPGTVNVVGSPSAQSNVVPIQTKVQ